MKWLSRKLFVTVLGMGLLVLNKKLKNGSILIIENASYFMTEDF